MNDRGLTERVVLSRYRVKTRIGHRTKDLLRRDNSVELKSVTRIVLPHEMQLVNYLVAPPAKRGVGLLLNFGERKVEAKRKVKDLSQG